MERSFKCLAILPVPQRDENTLEDKEKFEKIQEKNRTNAFPSLLHASIRKPIMSHNLSVYHQFKAPQCRKMLPASSHTINLPASSSLSLLQHNLRSCRNICLPPY